ncbi:MAG TPA: hypothetical protein VF252_11385, partial [Gemmatimonadales bacterium]
GQHKDIYIAVVAGDTQAELLVNAAAAEADVTNSFSQRIDGVSATSGVPPSAIGRSSSRSRPPICKNCKPQ